MNGLDDLPNRGQPQGIETKAILAFRNAISSGDLFQIQSDLADYGADFQIEALDGSKVTNFRVQVQVKGSTSEANRDGSVSVSVDRTNLNYLISQPNSIYVCWHTPTDLLLVAYADEVFYGYSAHGKDIEAQASITVRFRIPFDREFQKKLSARVLAQGRSDRDDRLQWGVTPPDQLHTKIRDTAPLIEVPTDPEKAYEVLRKLIDKGQDAVISRAFDRFVATLKGAGPSALVPVYLAEINLGITGQAFDETRVRDGIQLLHEVKGISTEASYHFCVGNGFLALKMLDEAREAFVRTQVFADESGDFDISAQASKNLGTVMEDLGSLDTARACYERALELNPVLPEAHWALGLWFGKFGNEPERALSHLEQVVEAWGSRSRVAALAGWKAKFLFETGREREAFAELNHLLSLAADRDWAWPWAARLVATHGKSTADSAERAVRFWDRYLTRHPEHIGALTERVLCLWRLRSQRKARDVTFQDYRDSVTKLIEASESASQKAFLWDRLGHWAQWDGNWSAAADVYRKAYVIEPERYGYCLGTALNFLGEYDEALLILQAQADEHLPDAMSWFQVGIAQSGLDDFLAAAEAFGKAIDLDEDYDRAWFNLGGMLWSAGKVSDAMLVWHEAAQRFPGHELMNTLPKLVRDTLREE